MSAADTRKPGALGGALKILPGLPALPALPALPTLPGLQRLGGLLPRRAGADGGAGRRRPWLLFGGMAAVLALSGAGLASVAVLRPATNPRPIPASAAAVPAPVDPLRRIRVVGDQLNLVTRTVGGQLFIYAGGPAGVQTALSLARSGAQGGIAPHVVSLSRLSSAVAEVFRGYGFEVVEGPVAADGPGVALDVRVPATLRPLHDAVAGRVAAAMAAAPGLSVVHLDETVKGEDGSFLLATMVGRPASRAFTAEGTKEVGDEVLSHFKLRAVETDRVELVRAAEAGGRDVRLVVPLHGETRLVSGGLDAIRPAVLETSIFN